MLKNEYGDDSVFVPNGFDFNKFTLVNKPEDRKVDSVSFLYSAQSLKRSEDTIQALKIVKENFPTLSATAFGLQERPAILPNWIEYYQMPDSTTHNAINNQSAIFVASSESEGWGLTVGEAMICGQAVCCTDNDGYKEMAIDGETALLSPVRNPEALANNIIRLIEDSELRVSIAKSGNEFIQQFRWEGSYELFKAIINN